MTLRLSDLNHLRDPLRTSEDGIETIEVYAVGKMSDPTGAGSNGRHNHLIFVEIIDGQLKPGSRWKHGDVFKAEMACRHCVSAEADARLDIADINCSRCEEVLSRIMEHLLQKAAERTKEQRT